MSQLADGSRPTPLAPPISRSALLVAMLWAGVALLLTAAAFAQETVAGVFGTAGSPDLLSALALATASFSFRFLRWHRLATRLAPELKVRASLPMQAIGFALSATPGKLGELLKVHLLAQQSGVPAARGASIVLVEKLTEALTFAALAAIGGLLVSATVAPDLTKASVVPVVGLAAVSLGLVALRVKRTRPDGRAFAARSGPLGWPLRRLQPLLGELSNGSERLTQPRPLGEAIALCLAARVCDAGALAIITAGLGFPVAFGVALLALGASGTIGGLSMLPGGVGAVEATMTGVLLAGGLDAPIALAATLIARGIIYWLWVAVGLVLAVRQMGWAREGTPGE